MPELKFIDSLKVALNKYETGGASFSRDPVMLAECLLAIVLTVLSVYLHAVFLIKAGAFWRDEANSVFLALMPGIADIWSALKFDAHPAFHVLIVRLWAGLFGSADTTLRAMGFVVGISIIAALWFKSIKLGGRAPLMSLFLIGLSPVMVRSLDSARPYGMAALGVVLAFTVVWLAVRKPGLTRIVTASFLLTLCTQTLYLGAVFVFAIGLGAISVGFLRGGYRQALFLSIPFGIAALSLLPHAGHLLAAQSWWSLAKNPAGRATVLQAFLDAVGSPTQWFMVPWAFVVILVTAGTLRIIIRHRSGENSKYQQDYFLFYCGITLVASTVCFLLFLSYTGPISLQAWYYVPLLVIVVVSSEPLIEYCISRTLHRILYLLTIAVFASTALVPSAQNLAMRMTSVDFVAKMIEQQAVSRDLVILNPWYYGVSFSRYYRGSAPWMTFPALRENAIHRYDLLKENMIRPETISEDIARISSTLQQGGRVWLVSDAASSSSKLFVAPLPPAPLPSTGWSSAPYTDNWSGQLMSVLHAHSHQVTILPFRSPQAINPLEALQVTIFRGWIP